MLAFRVDSFLLRLRAVSVGDIIRFIILGALVLIPLSSFHFYSLNSRLLITTLLVAFLALTIHDPIRALSALLVIALLFGNHPGGRYLEVFDFFLMIWVASSEFLTRKSRIYTFAGGYEWLFFFSCVLSVLASRFLIKDLFSHVVLPYFILRSNEVQSFYTIKMLIMTFTCISAGVIVYRLYLRRGERVLVVIARFIFIASAIAILAGILEVHNSSVARWLSRMRFFIDQDFGDTTPHVLLPFLKSLQGSTAAKGLFWNRGWFAVYLIAAFPFSLYFLHKNVITKESRWRLWSPLVFLPVFFYTLLLIGARGAFLAFMFSMTFYLTGLAFRGRYHKFLHLVPYLVFALTLLFPWGAFVDWMKPVLDPRTGFFKAGFEIGFSNPIFGGGTEAFGWNNTTYLAGTPLYSALHSTHNQVLQIFSGQGLVGVICYAALILLVIRSLNRGSASNKNYLPLMSGFLAVLVYSSFQEWFYLRSVQLLWWLLIVFCLITGGKKDSPSGTPHARNWRRLILLLVFACAAPIAAEVQHAPKDFGFSPSFPSAESVTWRWIMGKEGWCEIPADTSQLILQLGNRRPDVLPFFVSVEIPTVCRTTIRFDRTVRLKVLQINLPRGSGPHTLKVGCDRTWNRINFKRPDDRKLCIATHLEFVSDSEAH